MKRWRIFVLVLGVMLAMAVPVGAGKPDCSIDRDHPSCAYTLDPGSSCKNAGPEDGLEPSEVRVADTDPYVLTWTGTHQWCIDFGDHDNVKWDIPRGDWVIAVDGTLHRLLIVLRDSVNPGDACGLISVRGVTGADRLVLEDMPASGENACGLEYLDDPDDPQPFALVVWAEARGKNAPNVTMTVDVPGTGPGA